MYLIMKVYFFLYHIIEAYKFNNVYKLQKFCPKLFLALHIVYFKIVKMLQENLCDMYFDLMHNSVVFPLFKAEDYS